jgi:hypothetical protein
MTTFAPAMLPDEIKRSMALDLLAEFGGEPTNINDQTGEITLRCVLPWHDDRSPSAGFNYKKLVFACLSCHSSGGLLWFIGTCRGQSGNEVRAWVDTQIGLGGDEDSLPNLIRLIKALYARDSRAPEPIPKMSPLALKPWAFIHPYLTDPAPMRAVPMRNALDLKLGYAARFPVPLDNGGRGESERIVIPHFWRDSLVGWQTRRIYADGSPKYLLSPGHPRDRTLYDHDPSRGIAVVVESAMSVARHRHVLPMVATFGSEVTDSQVWHLADYDTVILWPDPDEAGWKALQGWEDLTTGQRRPGLAERLMPYSRVLVVASPWSVDPADLDEDAVLELAGAAVPYSQWRRPERLRCWWCKEIHTGQCP